MRLIGNGIQAVAPEVAVTFDGRAITGYVGESLAACLAAGGIATFRRTASGAGRGIFCGMGVCFDCLVRIDGRDNVRACMTPVAAGMTVETQTHPGGPPDPVSAAALPEPTDEPELLSSEVLVVGAGPAGLAAAKAAALSGCRVTVLDERAGPGGQYFKQLAQAHTFADDGAMDRQYRAGRNLIEEVKGLGVEILSDALVWGAFEPMEVCALVGERAVIVRPTALVIATGAYERGVPIPGWTLPGFMTTGAAQTLMRAYRVAPGRKVLLAGHGPLNFQVAAEMADAGVHVAALVEAAPRPGIAEIPAYLSARWHWPDLIADGHRYIRLLKDRDVPILHGHVLAEARGKDRVETAVVVPLEADGRSASDIRHTFQVDCVCVGYGFMPSNEISRALGCRHHFEPERGTLVVETDADGGTSIDGVYAAGDCGGMGGARAAEEEGFIAGAAAARRARRSLPVAVDAELAPRRRRLRSHRLFQRALWRLFRAPRLGLQLAGADTTICRCEEVPASAIHKCLDFGTTTADAVKRETRAGMGRCQGRYCGTLITELVAERTGTPVGEFSFFAQRPPIKPVPIYAIARDVPDELTEENAEGWAVE